MLSCRQCPHALHADEFNPIEPPYDFGGGAIASSSNLLVSSSLSQCVEFPLFLGWHHTHVLSWHYSNTVPIDITGFPHSVATAAWTSSMLELDIMLTEIPDLTAQ